MKSFEISKKILGRIFELGIEDYFSLTQLNQIISKVAEVQKDFQIKSIFNGLKMTKAIVGENPFSIGDFGYELLGVEPRKKEIKSEAEEIKDILSAKPEMSE